MLYPSTSAALAFLNSHFPPGLDSWSSVPLAPSSTDYQLSSKLSRQFRVTFTQAFSLAVLAIAVLVQLLRPSSFILQSTPLVSHPPTFSSCPNTNPLREALPICTRSKMGLIEDARRVAAEFEYPPDEVNRGVKAFIRQMGQYDRTEVSRGARG